MKIDLDFNELEEVLISVRMAAHEANKTANTALDNGYPPRVESEMAARASNLYLLADKIESQRMEFRAKAPGSSGSVDPFENVDTPKTPNDPIGW